MKNREILHIITNLQTGGAEMMLYKLLQYSEFFQKNSIVVALIGIGNIGEKIKSLGVPVFEIGMVRGKLCPMKFLHLIKLILRLNPKYVQTWMYHADLIGGLASKLAGCKFLFWGIHHSNLNVRDNNFSTIFTARVCSFLSHFLPNKIITCSKHAKLVHGSVGYDISKMIVIPNGFDISYFRPDSSARSNVLDEFALLKDSSLISLVGRFDPQKDHKTFVKAASIVLKEFPKTYFLLCGSGLVEANDELIGWLNEAKVRNNFLLLGVRDDISRIFAASSVAVSSSIGEGFPNVVGEAMASGIPCVVTDVGDSAYMVGDTGIVVQPSNELALADAIKKILALSEKERSTLGSNARKRVQDLFSIQSVVKMYESIYTASRM